MIKKNLENDRDKPYPAPTKKEKVLHGAAVGELPNDQVKKCYVCRDRGFPNEPIKIQKELGRALSDGTNEIVHYKLVDYITDRPHQHKEPKQQQQEGRYYKGWDLEALL
jgi:hypothetical protein